MVPSNFKQNVKENANLMIEEQEKIIARGEHILHRES
jgi:hypothetical protein